MANGDELVGGLRLDVCYNNNRRDLVQFGLTGKDVVCCGRMTEVELGARARSLPLSGGGDKMVMWSGVLRCCC